MKFFYSYILVIILLISCGKKNVKKEIVKEENPVVLDTIKESVMEEEVVQVPIIVFTVQIAALKNENTTIKNIENIQIFIEDNLTKYRLGNFKTYQEARSFRKSILHTYSDAFIQALKDDQPISITEALK